MAQELWARLKNWLAMHFTYLVIMPVERGPRMRCSPHLLVLAINVAFVQKRMCAGSCETLACMCQRLPLSCPLLWPPLSRVTGTSTSRHCCHHAPT